MENERYFEGKLTYIGQPKEFGTLVSVGLKVDTDESFHNISEFGIEKVKAILGTAKIGDLVSLRELHVKNYWNVKGVKFIEEVISENARIKTLDEYRNTLGNLYAMSEEKLNALIEQNANIQIQNANIIDLLMKIAKANNIELDTFKKATEI